jgi:hypothetical protein
MLKTAIASRIEMRSAFVVEESLLDTDDRCDLAYEDDEGAGELVDLDPIVPTVGAN